MICLFVCWYFVYNASYALRKNKFLTFLIVIQLVCFVGIFLLIFFSTVLIPLEFY